MNDHDAHPTINFGILDHPDEQPEHVRCWWQVTRLLSRLEQTTIGGVALIDLENIEMRVRGRASLDMLWTALIAHDESMTIEGVALMTPDEEDATLRWLHARATDYLRRVAAYQNGGNA